jgi:hypothetical protein
LIRELLIENRSVDHINDVSKLILKDKALFSELWELQKDFNSKIRMRSSWTMSKVVEMDDSLLLAKMDDCIDMLSNLSLDGSVKRNLIRALAFTRIPEDYFTVLFDLCNRFILDDKEAVAVRKFSMDVSYYVVSIFPELKQEYEEVLNRAFAVKSTSGLMNSLKNTRIKLKKL